MSGMGLKSYSIRWVWGFIHVCTAPPMGEAMSNGSLKKDGKNTKVLQNPFVCVQQTNLGAPLR